MTINYRFTAGTLAAVTALALTTGTAQAKTSSEVSDVEAGLYVTGEILKGNAVTSSGSSDSDPTDITKAIGSSLKNDTANGYPVGRTLQILMGVGIAGVVGILALAAHGAQDLISKVQLP